MLNLKIPPLPFCSLLIIIALTLSGCSQPEPVFECTDSIGCVDIEPGEPLKIGVIQALSGKVAPLGQEQLRGIELALDRWNQEILGHSLVLQIEDTGCSAEGGANAALKIIADPQTVAILGSTCSGAAATASKAMADAGLTMVSGNNSAPFLTSIAGQKAPNWQPGYFRTSSNEENAGQGAAFFAFHKLGLRKAATINDGDIYTRGLTNGFAKKFQEIGGEIVLETSINKGDTEMQPVLTAVQNAKAEILFFPLFQPEGNHLLLQARKMIDSKDLILMSDGALIENSFIEAVQEAGIGMYFVGPSSSESPASKELANKYDAKFSVDPAAIYYQNAYDAGSILLEAISKVAVQDTDGSLHIGRQELRQALYAVKDYSGVTGSLTCDQFGDCAMPVFNVLRLDDPEAGLEGLQSNVMFTYSPSK